MIPKISIDELLIIYEHILDGMGVQMQSKRELLAQYAHNRCSIELCAIDDNMQMSMLVLQALKYVVLTTDQKDVEVMLHKFEFDTNKPEFPKRNDKIETIKRTIITMLIKRYKELDIVVYSLIDKLDINELDNGIVEVELVSKINVFDTQSVNAQYQKFKETQTIKQ